MESKFGDSRLFESSNSGGTMEAKGRLMRRSVKKLFEDKLGASDGEIGHVNDFLDLTKEAILGSPVSDPAAFGIREHDPRIFV